MVGCLVLAWGLYHIIMIIMRAQSDLIDNIPGNHLFHDLLNSTKYISQAASIFNR